MASSNRIEVDLIANNLINGVLDGLQNKIGAIDNQVAGGAFFGSLWANLATSAISLVTDKVGDLFQALDDAGQKQTEQLATASDVATQLAVPLDRAKSLVLETQGEISKIAAALPGVTAGYNSVFNSIAPTIAKQFKGDTEAFKSVAMDITKRVGVLAAIRNVDTGFAGSAMNRFLAGTMTWGEAGIQDIFQKNPMLRDAIMSQAKAMGVSLDKWKTLNDGVRLTIVRNALKIATPDSLIDSFEGTYQSMIEGLKTDLFDPLIGAFGMLRKVDQAGGRNVLDAATQLLRAFTSLGDTIGEVAKRLGFDDDPLMPLFAVLDFFSDIVNSANLVLSGHMDFKGLTDGYGSFINNIYKNILQAITALNPSDIASAIGSGFEYYIGFLTNVLRTIDWVQVGEIFGQLLVKGAFLAISLLALVFKVDKGKILGLFLEGIQAVIKLFFGVLRGGWDTIVQAFATPVSGVVDAITGFFQKIVDFFKMLWDKASGLVSSVANAPGNAVAAVMAPVQAATTAVSNAIPQPVKNAVGGALDAGGKALEATKGALGGLMGQSVPNSPKSSPGSPNSPEAPKVSLFSPSTTAEPLSRPNLNPVSKQVAFGSFNPQISVQGSGNAEEAANLMLRKLGELYQDYQRQQLA
jgi:hypothetical protein